MRTLCTLMFLALLGSLNGAIHLHAQDLRFEHLTTADGLPDNHVTAILQDHLGLLWFGTTVALVKYDGYTYTVYKPEDDDPTSISGSQINALHEDASGNLWIGTTNGLNRLDRATERFTRYLHDPNDPTSLPDNAVFALTASAATPELLWIGTERGLSRFHPETGTFTLMFADLENLQSQSIYEAPSEPGILWMGSSNGAGFRSLTRFDTVTGSFTSYRLDLLEPTNINFTGIRDQEDRTGMLWVATWGDGLYRFDRQTGLFEHFMPNPANPSDQKNSILSLHQDPEGTLWLGSIGGQLGQFNPETETFTWHQHDPKDPTSLGSNTWISVLYPDRDGVLWIGTRGGGLSVLDRSASLFTTYIPDQDKAHSIGEGNIRAILEDRSGTLWIGASQNLLDRWDRSAGTITPYRNNPGNPRSLGPGQIVALYEDAGGVLWAGTCSGGLGRFERTTETFTHFRHDPANPGSLSDDCVNAILEDRSGRFWVGTYGGGLNRFDKVTGTFTRYQHDPDDPHSLPGNLILAHLEDRDGSLWFGLDGREGEGGLVKFDPESGHFTSYLSPHLRVMALYEDQAGHFWVGTAGSGLFRFDRETGQHKNYTTKDGLAHNIVWAILEDDEGYLWISTDNGLSRFDVRTETFRNYDTQDGLQSHIFGERAAFKSASGEMFFGGQRGLTTFFPDRIKSKIDPPPVILTEFRVAGTPIGVGEDALLKTHINVAEEITLAHHQKDVSLSFAALSYQRAEKNRYSFYLEGYDDTWRAPGPVRTATYTNLDPGTYVFRVKASNRDGVWNEEGASLRITIQPPWWRTWWAYALYGLVFLTGVFVVDRFQRRRLVRKEREKSLLRENKLRTDAAEAIANYLQSENLRQTQELDAARELQLSMLPEAMPEHPTVELAAFMQTATEVGGDYYDFDLSDDGTLMIAIGDATGHGTKAGTMVTATKSLWHAFSGEPDLVVVLQKSSRALKKMGLPKLYMALALARVRDHTLELAGAGMPPALVYRASTQQVEQIPLKGMPLGGPGTFPYKKTGVLLSPGDTVMLMSDGFPELFNKANEMLGYERAVTVFEEVAHQSPEQIIDHFKDTAASWMNKRAQNDDVTFVVMKVKTPPA